MAAGAAASLRPRMSLALVFPGQGSQYVGMCKDLFAEFPTAMHLAQQADEILGFSLSKLMTDGPMEELTKTENCQPALLLHSVAVFRTLKLEFGVNLSKMACVMLGHSLGEYSALVCAQSLRFSDALFLVRKRGLAMRDAVQLIDTPTRMSALMIRANRSDDLADLCEKVSKELGAPHVCEPANMNSPSQVVVSGTVAAIERVCELGRAAGIVRRAVTLPVSAPFHSSFMKPVGDVLEPLLENLNIRSPAIPVLSNVTSAPMVDTKSIRQLLPIQASSPVLWSLSLSRAISLYGANAIVELGPGSALTNMARSEYPSLPARSVGTSDVLREVAKQIQEIDSQTV